MIQNPLNVFFLNNKTEKSDVSHCHVKLCFKCQVRKATGGDQNVLSHLL